MNAIKQFFSSWKGWAITGATAAVIAVAAVVLLKKSAAYVKVIPSDAKMVMMVDPAGFIDKCNLKEHSIIVDKLKDLAAHVPGEDGDMLSKLIDDPTMLGVDVSQPAYFFLSGDMLTGMKFGFVLAVKDKNDLKKNIEKVLDAIPHHRDSDFDLDEDDGYVWGITENNPVFAFDGETLLIMAQLQGGKHMQPATKAQFKKLFDLKSDEQFTSTTAWEKMQSTEGEGQFFLSGGIIPQMFIDMAQKQSGVDFSKQMGGLKLKDINFLATLVFEEGQVSFISELFGADSESQEILESKFGKLEKLSDKYLGMANEQSLGWACCNLAGVPIEEYMKNTFGKEALISAEQGLNVDLTGFLKALSGQFAMAFNGDLKGLVEGNVSEEDFICENLLVAAEVDKTDFMNHFDEAQFGNDVAITRKEGNVYQMSFETRTYNWDDYDYNYYTVDSVAVVDYDEYDDYDEGEGIYDDDVEEDSGHYTTSIHDFFIGTDANKNFFFVGNKAYGPNMFKNSNSRLEQHKDEITNSYSYLWIDLKKILNISLEREFSRMPAKAKELIDLLDEVIVKGEKPLMGKFSLTITQKDKNILDVLTGYLADFVKENL